MTTENQFTPMPEKIFLTFRGAKIICLQQVKYDLVPSRHDEHRNIDGKAGFPQDDNVLVL